MKYLIDKNYRLGYIRRSYYQYLAPCSTTQLTVYLWGFKASYEEKSNHSLKKTSSSTISLNFV